MKFFIAIVFLTFLFLGLHLHQVIKSQREDRLLIAELVQNQRMMADILKERAER